MKLMSNAARISLRCLGLACLVVVGLPPMPTRAGQEGRGGEMDRAAASPKDAAMTVEAPVDLPDIIAVRFRHDMCPYCQRFDPQFPKLVRSSIAKASVATAAWSGG